MLDWRIEETRRLIVGGTDDPRRLTLPLLLVGVVLLLVGASIYRQFRAGEARRFEQVRLAVLAEERARAFELVDELANVVDPAAPDGWRVRYHRWFERGRIDRGVSVDVTALILDADGALVHVERDGVGGVRFYRHGDDGWRRAPIPAAHWGAPAAIYSETRPGVAVRFHERDRAFAERLARDLPALLATVGALADAPVLRSITIDPVEFATLPATRDGGRIRVVSPELLERGPPWGPEERTRLEIARLLLRESGPPAAALRPLRNARRMVVAGREIVAQRWALRPETRAAHRSAWAATLNEGWVPALHTDRDHLPGSDGSFFALDPSQAATMLFVDALVERSGERRFFEMLAGVDAAHSWDELMQTHYGASLHELEVEVSRDVLGIVSIEGDAPPTFPVTGRVVATFDSVDRHLLSPGFESPLLLSGDTAMVTLPGGGSLPIGCATLFSEVEISGRWREIGRELEVGEVRVPEVAPVPLPVTAVPDDVVAIAIHSRGHLLSVPVDPSLVIVDGEGRLRAMLPLDGVNLVPDRGTPPSTFLLLSQTAEGCPVTWYFRFEPGRGIVDQWLVDRPEGARSGGFVRVDGALIVLQARFTPGGARSELYRLRPGGTSERLTPRALEGGNLLGWSARHGTLVLNGSREGALTLFDPRRQTATSIDLALPVGRFGAALDPEEGTLLFIAPGAAPVGGGASLLEYDLATGALKERWHASGALIARALAVGADGTPVVLISGPDRHAEPTRLLQLESVPAGRALEIAATEEGRYIGTFELCPDGTVLFTDHPSFPVAGRATTRLYRTGGDYARLQPGEIEGTLLLARCER